MDKQSLAGKAGKHILKAEPRKITGRKVKDLRREGVLPGNIYGKKVKSQAVQTALTDLEKVYAEVGETGLVELKVDGKTKPVLIHNLQKDPVTDSPIHVDFLQVDLKEKVSAKVAVELSGESPAEKQGLGTVVLYVNEVEVEALPGDLPEKFMVDVSNLAEVDQAIYIKDLGFDKKKIGVKAEPETIVVKVEPPQKEEEVVPPPTEAVVAEGAAAAEAEAGKEAPAEGIPEGAVKEGQPKEEQTPKGSQ